MDFLYISNKIKKLLDDSYKCLFMKKNKFKMYKIKMHIKKMFIKYSSIDCYAKFISEADNINKIIMCDFHAIYNGDPAAQSIDEIVACYPGAYAIFVYRYAHYLYNINLKSIARIMSEYAHSKTGIDIHPGATIGKNFCIDHGTGIVIGETCEIGDDVKVYQGVTLGALSLKNVDILRGAKRHPTIKNNVVIYSSASILGGETIIGNNVVIGSNAFIVSSIDDNSMVIPKRSGYDIKNI